MESTLLRPEIRPEELFETRALTIFDAEDLREVRLESLRHYGKIFENFHAREAQKPIEYWEKQCTETAEHCFFGTFFNDELVGVSAARKWEELPKDHVALWWGNYMKREYQDIGASRQRYIQRIEWCKRRGFSKAVLYVLDGATRPESIIQKLEGQKIDSRKMSFADGPEALWHWYELNLLPRSGLIYQLNQDKNSRPQP